MNPVTVPGDIPGLLREGAKVRRHEDPTTGLTQYGVVVRVRDDSIIVASASFGVIEWPVWLRTKQVDLLLSEPINRDIVARWIADKLGVKVGLTAPNFRFQEGMGIWGPGWAIDIGWQTVTVFRTEQPAKLAGFNIPSLPMNREMGTEAMRQIVLYLAGRAP